MVRFTFTTENSEAERLFAILQAYGVENLEIENDEKLDTETLRHIDEGLEDLKNGRVVSAEEVHRQAEEICMK